MSTGTCKLIDGTVWTVSEQVFCGVGKRVGHIPENIGRKDRPFKMKSHKTQWSLEGMKWNLSRDTACTIAEHFWTWKPAVTSRNTTISYRRHCSKRVGGKIWAEKTVVSKLNQRHRSRHINSMKAWIIICHRTQRALQNIFEPDNLQLPETCGRSWNFHMQLQR